ncbi:MAG TPA: hemerythrin domain-containing protein, partial [Burkholderiales bacterium]|nr:hemerythrin domain-containing protein [Burkholderiales bacterium]
VEHESVEILIDKLAELEPSDPMYAANFTVLAEYVDHHVKEEEKEMFPKVRKLKDLDLDELGDEMQARKDDLLGQLGEVEDETLIADEAEKETALKRGGSQESSRRPRAAK